MADQIFSEFFNQKLKERRLTLAHLSEMTGISMKHLEAFSHGRFELLPPKPYLRGYFMRLGEILNFDPGEWWERVRQDETVTRSGSRDIMAYNRFSMRQSRALLGVGAAIVLVILYLGFRATKIIGKPELNVTEPAADTTRVGESHIFVAGNIKNGDEVDINGEQIPTETDGSFHKDVALQPGVNDINITAKKVLGRSTTIIKHAFYDASPIQILLPESPGTTIISSSTKAKASSSATSTP